MRTGAQQQRLKLLLPGMTLILILAWSMAIRKTLNSYTDLKKTETELNGTSISDATITALKQELKTIKSKQDAAEGALRPELVFKKIADLCSRTRNTRIIRIPEVHQYTLDGYQIETMKMELEGSFSNLLRFLYNLEHEKAVGKIASAGFSVVVDFKQKKEYLRLTLFIQKFHKNPYSNEDEKKS